MADPENAPPGETRAGAVLAPALLLTIVVFLVFGRAIEGELVYDDLRLIARNPRVTGGVSLWEAVSTSHWGFDDPAAEGAVGYWRPLTVLVLRLGWWLGDGSPVAFHLLSILLHLGASLAAWRFVTRLFGDGRAGFCAGLLFALHPVHVESVAWISAVNDPLFGLFVLLALGDWMKSRARSGGRWAWRPALWLLLGALSKEHALTLVPMLIVIELALGRAQAGGRKTQLRRWLPMGASLLVLWGLRMWVFGDALAGIDRVNSDFQPGLARGISFRFELFGGFVGLLALPLQLEVFRPFRPLLPPLDATFYAALGWTALWIVAAVWAWKKEGARSLALLGLVPAAVAPVLISIDAAGLFPFSDRYLYVAAIVPAALVAQLAVLPRWQRLAVPASCVLALLWGLRSYMRGAIWLDEERLFRAAAKETPRSPYVNWGLGRVLLLKYRASGERQDLEEALLHFLTSLMLGHDFGENAPKLPPDAPLSQRVGELVNIVHPEITNPADPLPPIANDPTVWASLDDRLQANLGQGYCFFALSSLTSEFDLSLPFLIFRRQTETFPKSYEAWTALGSVQFAQGKPDEALQSFGKAIQLNPAYAEAWNNQGRVLAEKGQWDPARKSFERSLEFRPNHLPTLLDRARAAIEGKRWEFARDALERARQLDPESLEPDYLTGMLFAARADWSQALQQFDRVVRRSPDHGPAYLQRGKVLLRLQELNEAVRSFGKACELSPSSFEPHYAMGALLQQSGDGDSALPYLIKAYELAPADGLRIELEQRLRPLVEGKLDLARQLAQLARRRQEWEAAKSWLHLVLIEEPTWADGHLARGQAERQLGNFDEARSALETCVELDPEHFWGHHDLGTLLHEMGDPLTARLHLSRVLELLDDQEAIAEDLKQAIRENVEELLGE